MCASKCTEELKLRMPPELVDALARLAHQEDRKLSEYIRVVLSLHVFGHAQKLAESDENGEGHNGV